MSCKKFRIWEMSKGAKRFELTEAELARRHKNGVDKWRKALDKEGSCVIGEIPRELRDEVLHGWNGVGFVELRRETTFTEQAMEGAIRVDQNANPEVILQHRLQRGLGNGGQEVVDTKTILLSRLAAKPALRLLKR